jgi:hypothetical protein
MPIRFFLIPRIDYLVGEPGFIEIVSTTPSNAVHLPEHFGQRFRSLLRNCKIIYNSYN